MIQVKKIDYEKCLFDNNWSVMPQGEVEDSSSIFKAFKYSDEVDLCAVCEIFKTRKKYKLVFRINDLLGEPIVKKSREGQKDEIFRWLMRCTFGDSAAYLSGHTNIKEIKEVRKKYRKK